MFKEGRVIFYLFLALHLVPFFSVDIFLTLDGASHLYNAKLFNELLAGNEFLTTVFQVNKEVVPNYLGHFLLSFFLLFLKPVLALKVFHILYVVGLAFSFKSLVKAVSPKSEMLSVLIFPFIYSSLFVAGFYNFSLAIILLFLTLRYWLLNNSRTDIGFYVSLASLFFLTFLAHSFTFLFLCLSIAVFTSFDAIKERDYKKIVILGKKAIVAVLPSLVFSVLFILKRSTDIAYIPVEKLWADVRTMWFLATFDTKEQFQLLWLVIIILSLVTLLGAKKRDTSFSFFYLLLIATVFYFYLPDRVGEASVFSQRMLYIAFLFWVLWLATQNYPRFLQYMVVATLFVFQFKQVVAINKWAVYRNNKAKEMLAVGKLIPANSIIKPIRELEVWGFFHLSNFMGVEKPQVILENYEAKHDLFPVKWKINLEKAFKEREDCFFQTTIQGKTYTIDYLVVFGNGKTDDACEQKQINYANNKFQKIYESNFITAYKVEF